MIEMRFVDLSSIDCKLTSFVDLLYDLIVAMPFAKIE